MAHPCTVFCTAVAYNLKGLYQALSCNHCATSYRDLIHVEVGEGDDVGDAFFFPYGTLVTWNLSEAASNALLDEANPFEEQPLIKADEDRFSYTVAAESTLKDEAITLADDDTTTKMAFSQALAQSARLGTFEESLTKTIQRTKHLPQHLAQHGKIPLSRKAIRRQVGALFMERSAINLHLDVLDTPEFFWEHPEFENLYIQLAEELDLSARTRALNQQLDVLHNLFEMLSTEWSDQHSNRLEWAIIWLIIIEVLLFFTHDILKLI